MKEEGSNRGRGNAVSLLPRLIVGTRHCRFLTVGNINIALIQNLKSQIPNLKFPYSHPSSRYTIKPMYSFKAVVDWCN